MLEKNKYQNAANTAQAHPNEERFTKKSVLAKDHGLIKIEEYKEKGSGFNQAFPSIDPQDNVSGIVIY